VTALAVAGAGGGAVAPDLVLPPGFDRVGDVVRFEQDSGPAVELAPTGHGDDAPGFHPEPAGEGQEPALSHNRVGRPSREVHAARWEMGGADVTPCARCGLRGHVAGDPDRCLYYRGSFGLGGQAAQAGEH
jgi:hypothetical protein